MEHLGTFAWRLAGEGEGPTLFGTWVTIPALETEMLGHAGFDVVVVDMGTRRVR